MQISKLQKEITSSRVYKEGLFTRSISLKDKLSEKEIKNRTMDDEMRRDTKAKEEVVKNLKSKELQRRGDKLDHLRAQQLSTLEIWHSEILL